MKTIDLVERTLRDHPKSRDSDKLLMLYVWHHEGFVLTPEQRAKFMRLSSAESIRRIRQKLQEQGKYSSSEHVATQRRIKSYVVQQNEPTASPERLGKLTQGELLNIPVKRVL